MAVVSQEVGTIVTMILFMAAYLTFSNNFHFSEPKATLVDKMFQASSRDGLRNAMNVAAGDAGSRPRSPGAGSGSFDGGRLQSSGSPGVAAQAPSAQVRPMVGRDLAPRRGVDAIQQQVAAAEAAWPPKLSIFLGDASSPPSPQTGQPDNGCLYENIDGHMWRFCLPSLLTISCINCGTTSLGAYLDSHAHLSVGTKKEHKFFVVKCADDKQGEDYECDWEAYVKEFPSLPQGCSWNPISGQASFMKRDFNKAFSNMDCGQQTQAEMSASVAANNWADVWGLDISPKYFFVPGAARRIHKMMPHARMVALLRNPVDRHLSHIEQKFRMQVIGRRGGPGGGLKGASSVSGEQFHSCVDAVAQKWGKATSGEGLGPAACPSDWVDKAEAFFAEERSYSYYIHHFRTWFDLYGKDRFLFISDKTLHDEGIRQQLMNEISVFAGVPQYQYAANSALYDDSLSHASTKKWTVSNRLREVLWDMFELDEHNAELYQELGQNLGWKPTK